MEWSTKMLSFNLPAIKRWDCFIAAIWLQSINGTNFVFSDYSSALKNIMGINQLQLNSLAVEKLWDGLQAWRAGFCQHGLFLPLE